MEVICNKYKSCTILHCIHKHIHDDQGDFCEPTKCASTQQIVVCNNKPIRKEKLKNLESW